MLISKTFFDPLARLLAGEKARVLDFLGLFQANPAHPGMSLERLAGKSGFWSGRISRDLRAILAKDGDTWSLLYAAHHDDAYDWAKRRTCKRHPVTGVLEIVETVETVRELKRVVEVTTNPPVFAQQADDYLLSLGVPTTWLPSVREIRDDDALWAVCERLGDEVAERLIDLAAGKVVTPPRPCPPEHPAIEHPDTRRRFLSVHDDGLLAALAAPLERWIAFLHPSQKTLVEGTYNGPVKVTGAAGTGKTVVALHRARHLARQGRRVLVTSFVKTLCRNNEKNLALLCQDGELERITVSTVHSQAFGVVRKAEGSASPANDHEIRKVLDDVLRRQLPDGFDAGFVHAEWENVVHPQALESWAEYRAVRRIGRGRALSVRERKALWSVFDAVIRHFAERGQRGWPRLCRRAEELVRSGRVTSPFDAVVVDEVQDLKAPEVRFLGALCPEPGHLMLVGDAGQRIYPGGFSLKQLGIETRGRSRILRVNYRTTEQIRRAADRLLGAEVDDLDGGRESRLDTRSLLSGPRPTLSGFTTQDDENAHLVATVREALRDGVDAPEIGVFARSNSRVKAVLRTLEDAEIPARDLKDETAPGGVGVGTMHRAKGLEFRLVLVSGCARGVVPSAALADLDDPLDREHAEERERRLLYVAMTRARDQLHVTWTGQPSPFLEPLLAESET